MLFKRGANAWNEREPQPQSWAKFMEIAEAIGATNNPHVTNHLVRHRHTLAAIEDLSFPANAASLEIGASWLFALMLRLVFKFSRVDVTNFDPNDGRKVVPALLNLSGQTEQFDAFNINLEQEPFPLDAETYDFVMCCEVIEHMETDPMFMMCEINRICRPGARLLITTPNVCSSQNLANILMEEAPHFYMQYHKDHSMYRHNLEYSPGQLREVVMASGFEVERHWTANTFAPPSQRAIELLQRNSFPTGMRGDNMFMIARKAGGVRERHPAAVYV